ncbi:hypothetical protein [Winogradskyella sp.]|uniref:hypothetical protein n=1 Tax=Winogradskyella sp. TaxID=1883156 RepID=UPI002608A999|nr:hypothetical protein [Winogradskyella sp.]
MKTLITTTLALMSSLASISQEKNIETESTTIDNLITFIVEHFSIETDSTQTKNITFLVETYAENFNTEDSVILKQAFKLLSKRVSQEDLISIVTYSNFSGIALDKAEATDIKKLLYVIEHPKSSVKTFEGDGIELAYEFAKENFVEESENVVIMIRIPSNKDEVAKSASTKNDEKKKTKTNAVVLTAMALLPEIIAVIKD